MKANRVYIKFSETVGKIKPMHGTGGGPRQTGVYLRTDVSDIFREIGVPFSRLHDIEGAYSMNQFIDIHCVFPDFNADENDPSSYNFIPTDNYLKGIINAGTQVFYRLGESIDHFPKKIYVHPPKDYGKWARICEHVIRHYNEGWANGFNFNVLYWEIWNEPDNPLMWTGTFDGFYELYKVTARHLKKCFPALKIGGYSASGFYTVSRPEKDCGDWFKTLVPYTEKFFGRLSEESERVPMDFFSWHCYAIRPEEIRVFALFARELLAKHGYSDAESILTEYNSFRVFSCVPAKTPDFAAEIAAGLIVAQNSPVDAVMYYDMRLSAYNDIFAKNLYGDIERLHGFYVFKSFGDLYRLENQCESDCKVGGVYVLAAKKGDKAGVMLAVRDFCGVLHFDCDLPENAKIAAVRHGYENYNKPVLVVKTARGFKLKVKKDDVYYIEISL